LRDLFRRDPLSDADKAVARARELAGSGRVAQAAELLWREFQRIGSAHPGAALKLYSELAALYVRVPDRQGLERLLASAAEFGPSLDEEGRRRLCALLGEIGLGLSAGGNTPLALRFFHAAGAYGEPKAEVRTACVRALLGEGRNDPEAVEVYLSYLTAPEGEGTVKREILARLEPLLEIQAGTPADQQRRRTALNRRLIQAGFGTDWAWANVGRSCLLSGDWLGATEAFLRAGVLKEADSCHLGVAAANLGFAGLARGALEAYLGRNPEDAEARLLLGKVCLEAALSTDGGHGPDEAGAELLREGIAHLERGLGLYWSDDDSPGFEAVLSRRPETVIEFPLQYDEIVSLLARGYDLLAAPKRALAMARGNAQLHARLLARHGLADQALEVLEPLIQERRSAVAVEALLLSGSLLYERDPGRATALLEQAAARAPDDAEANLGLAAVLLDRGEAERAGALLDRCLALLTRGAGAGAPGRVGAARLEALLWFLKGRAAAETGSYGEAREFFAASLEVAVGLSERLHAGWKDRHRRLVQLWLARCHLATGMDDEARAILEDLVRRDPRDPDPAGGLALLELACGRPEGAGRWLATRERGQPEAVTPRLARGLLLMAEGDAAGARAELLAASHTPHPPVRALASYLLGGVLRKGGEAAEALDYLREACRTDPSLRPAVKELGVLLAERAAAGGPPAEAEEARALLEAFVAREEDPEARCYWALAALACGKEQEALEVLAPLAREPLAARPQTAAMYLDLMGTCLLKQEKWRAAREFWEQGLALAGFEGLFGAKVAYACLLEALDLVGQTGNREDRLGEALELLADAYRRFPDPELLFYRSCLELFLGRFSEAGEGFNELVAGRQHDEALLFGAANELFRRGTEPEAAARAGDWLREYLQAAGSTGERRHLAALLLGLEQGDPAAAGQAALALAEAGKAACLPFPGPVIAEIVAAGLDDETLASRGAEALKRLAEVCAGDTRVTDLYARALALKACRLARQGRPEEALKLLDEGIELCGRALGKGSSPGPGPSGRSRTKRAGTGGRGAAGTGPSVAHGSEPAAQQTQELPGRMPSQLDVAMARVRQLRAQPPE